MRAFAGSSPSHPKPTVNALDYVVVNGVQLTGQQIAALRYSARVSLAFYCGDTIEGLRILQLQLTVSVKGCSYRNATASLLEPARSAHHLLFERFWSVPGL
jgi:hypothetical protein